MFAEPQKPVFLFAFANDAQASLRVGRELAACAKALKNCHDSGLLEFVSLGYTTLEDIYDSLERFDQRLCLFHFGGHSDSSGLHFSDKAGRAESLATVLGKQKKLKLVFLNGCANAEQVKILWAQGVSAIIATSAQVQDDRALTLADRFYRALGSGQSLQDAFDTAKSFVANEQEIDLDAHRGIKLLKDAPVAFPWGLYVQDESVLNWKLDQLKESRLRRLLRVTFVPLILIALTLLAVRQWIRHQPVDLTVGLDYEASNPELAFEEGTISLQLESKSLKKTIRQGETVNFADVPARYRNRQPATLSFRSPGFEPIDTTLLLREEGMQLPIRRDGRLSRIAGTVMDEEGKPLAGIAVRVQGLQATTDQSGAFALRIPPRQQRKEQRVQVFHPGYLPWDHTTPVLPDEPLSIILTADP